MTMQSCSQDSSTEEEFDQIFRPSLEILAVHDNQLARSLYMRQLMAATAPKNMVTCWREELTGAVSYRQNIRTVDALHCVQDVHAYQIAVVVRCQSEGMRGGFGCLQLFDTTNDTRASIKHTGELMCILV
jgi:hypothetical protein